VTTTPDDLVWWLKFAPSLDWTWARTYADKAPHWYVNHRSILTREEFQRAARVIHTFGEPCRYFASTNFYLSAGKWRWWTMDKDLDDTGIINRAVNDRVYGVQDAPRTFSAAWTEFDAVATHYDKEHARDAERDEEVMRRVIETFGTHKPPVIDVGAGTSAAFDLGVTLPQRLTAIDPSQAMLNRLVKKHPAVGRALPGRLDEIRDAMLSPGYELVLALDVPNLSDEDQDRMKRLATGLIIVA
jgi:hypothetical protein